ncbi:Hsp20/alpha crystallin family protein [Nesterenkonia sp. LB17]|uniref:Hsp20/alpha crystallin family protein n=1 Tax=Nesterenkonia sp. LB17 TaxID=2901230 RepID=UPI001F4CF01F|nr:Hsp20/alpha crystallin family protein [Nesterenkonia sp. LB17]MCH8566432.1 Hsp20/alpha crystallin family protein [Nesterenkonia sp. LB17]
MTDHLSRFDSLAGLVSLRCNLFDDGMRGTPSTDVYTRDEKELVVEAHLPNFADTDITVSVDDRTLVIQAERREREEDKGKRYLLRESTSSFRRSVDLPEQAKDRQIRAVFDHGVLTVSVPLEESTTLKWIPIDNGHSNN